VAYCQCILSSLLYGTSFSPLPFPPLPLPLRLAFLPESALCTCVPAATSRIGRVLSPRSRTRARARARSLTHGRLRSRGRGSPGTGSATVITRLSAERTRWKSARESPIESFRGPSLATRARLYANERRTIADCSSRFRRLFVSLSLSLSLSRSASVFGIHACARLARSRRIFKQISAHRHPSVDVRAFDISWLGEKKERRSLRGTQED